MVAAILVLFQAASSAPAPLYVVYQRQWGFSSATLTLVFAIYVFGLLGSLLVLGGLSDHVGRRPVLAAAIAREIPGGEQCALSDAYRERGWARP